MYKSIEIGGQTLDLLSNGATPIYYQQIFGKDIVKGLVLAGEDRVIAVNMAPELAFVMMHQANKTDMSKLNFDMYVEWLEGFGSMDFVEGNDLIWEAYYGTMKTSVEPKKKGGAPKGK